MATEINKNNGAEDEISLKELILNIQEWMKYLWSKWYILLIAGIVGGALGLLYALNKKPTYTATTTFVLESGEKGGLSQYAGMAAMVGIDLGGNAGGLFQGDNILELYKSRTMLEKTLLSKTYPDSNELLIERYIAFNELRATWEEKPELLALDFKQNPITLDQPMLRLRDSLITDFSQSINENNLIVSKPDKMLSIIKVEFVSNDEVFSKSFNDALVRHVNEFYIQTKTNKSKRNIEILQHKVDSVRAVMGGAISTAATVVDATPNLNPTRQAQRIIPSQQAQFSAETNKAILGQLVQNLEASKMTLLQEQPLIQVVDQPVYPLKVEELGKAKATVIGGFLFGFLALVGLVLRRYYRDIMEERSIGHE